MTHKIIKSWKELTEYFEKASLDEKVLYKGKLYLRTEDTWKKIKSGDSLQLNKDEVEEFTRHLYVIKGRHGSVPKSCMDDGTLDKEDGLQMLISRKNVQKLLKEDIPWLIEWCERFIKREVE
jgi:hypothetical protein